MRELDLKGLKCPLPAIKTRGALARLARGDTIAVLTTDPLAAIDIPNVVREAGHQLLGREERDGALVFVIRRSTA